MKTTKITMSLISIAFLIALSCSKITSGDDYSVVTACIQTKETIGQVGEQVVKNFDSRASQPTVCGDQYE